MLAVNGNRVLVKQHLKKLTKKEITMKDVHNIAAKVQDCQDKSVQGMLNVIKTEFPHFSYKLVCEKQEVNGKLTNVVRGIMLQSPTMRRDFERFPELLFSDSTYSLNSEDIPLYGMAGVDGRGRTKPVALFLLTDEKAETLGAMLELFKENNPSWCKVSVVLTDKDMTERGCFSDAFPGVSLQICLFHVKRNFRREITGGKYNITSSEREEYLEYMQRMVHAVGEDDYQDIKEEFMDNCPHASVRQYFLDHWHDIRNEWVCGLVAKLPNFGIRTTNHIEQFFRSVKSVVQRRKDMGRFIRELLTVVDNLNEEDNYKLLYQSTTVPTTRLVESSGLDPQYMSVLTDKAYKHVAGQMKLVNDNLVKVIDETTVLWKDDHKEILIHPTDISCPCDTFKKHSLPCRHMLALQHHNNTSTFLPNSISIRHTRAYNNPHFGPHLAAPLTPTMSFQAASKKRHLRPNDKYRTALEVMKTACSAMSSMSAKDFDFQMQRCRAFVSSIVEGTSYHEPTAAGMYTFLIVRINLVKYTHALNKLNQSKTIHET